MAYSKPKVISTVSQLKGAFKRHGKSASSGDTDSHYLLLFYASECGLKHLYLSQNHLQDTSNLIEKFTKHRPHGYSHDLVRWIDELKIPGFVVNWTDSQDDPVANIHEKLRYGVGIQISQKKKLSELFRALKKQIK